MVLCLLIKVSDRMDIKTGMQISSNNNYEFETFDSNKEFLLGELKNDEIRDKIITCKEILENHLNNNYKKGDVIEIENSFDKPLLRKFIQINDVTDEMIDIMYFEHQILYQPYKFVTLTAPMQRGRILIEY